jgi:hypothetical protein
MLAPAPNPGGEPPPKGQPGAPDKQAGAVKPMSSQTNSNAAQKAVDSYVKKNLTD